MLATWVKDTKKILNLGNRKMIWFFASKNAKQNLFYLIISADLSINLTGWHGNVIGNLFSSSFIGIIVSRIAD